MTATAAVLTVVIDGTLRDDHGAALPEGLAWVRREFRESNSPVVYLCAPGAREADVQWLWHHRMPPAPVVSLVRGHHEHDRISP